MNGIFFHNSELITVCYVYVTQSSLKRPIHVLVTYRARGNFAHGLSRFTRETKSNKDSRYKQSNFRPDYILDRIDIWCRFWKLRCFAILNILGDPGAVSRVGRKGVRKCFQVRAKEPLVPTLTELFPKIQVDAGSWLGTKNALYYCAQSANSNPTDRPWVSEDA